MSSYIDSSIGSSTTCNINENELLEEKKLIETNTTGFRIAKVIKDLLFKNRTLNNYNQKIKEQSKMIFSSKKIPKIPISDYIQRIIQYTGIENSSLITSLIYLDRICQNDILITDYNIHRLLLMSIIMSIKNNEDIIYENGYYSKVAGVTIKEFNKLESDFLILLEFKLFVSEEEFFKYKFYLEKYPFN